MEKIRKKRGAAGCHLPSPASGFTLVEVLIALLLFLFGSLAFFQLFLTSIRVNQVNRQYLMAQDAASAELEQVKTIGYAGIANSSVLTGSAFSYVADFRSLPAAFQLAGVDTTCEAPHSYCVYKWLEVKKTVNGTEATYRYTLKLCVNPFFLAYPALAEVDGLIYWAVGNDLKSMKIAAFVGM